MSRTVIPKHECSETEHFYPSVAANYVLGLICDAVGAPVYRGDKIPLPYPAFPYTMTEAEATDTANKINEAIQQNKVELVFAYDAIQHAGYFRGNLQDFIVYCKEFAIFLQYSKGYECI